MKLTTIFTGVLGLLLNTLIWGSPVVAQASDVLLDQNSSLNTPGLFYYLTHAEAGTISHIVDNDLDLTPIRPQPLRPIVIASKILVKPKPVIASVYDHWFNQYANQFGVDEGKLKRIAYCESHFNPAASSKNGTYGGMYQYSASTWISTRKTMGLDPNPDLRFDPESAIMTTAFKIAAGGIKAWPVCGLR